MADSFDLATAYVQIVPTTQNIGSNLQTTIGDPAASAGDSAGEECGNNFASKLKNVLVAAGIGAAVAAAINGVKNAVNDIAEAGDDIDKTSQKLGVSAEEYQALSYAAEHCGFSTSVYSTAVKKLQQADYEGTLTDYLDSLMEIEDPTERAAAAQEMLGEKTANEMMAYINGEQTMSEYGDQLEELGGMMSNEAVANSAAYEDALTDMQTAMSGVKTAIFADLLPGFSEAMNGIAAFVGGDEGGLQTAIDGIASIAGGIIEKIPEVISGVGQLVSAIVQYIAENGPSFLASGMEMLGNMASGFLSNLPTMISNAGTMLTEFINYIGNNLPTILQQGSKMLGQLAQGIIKNLPAIVSSIASVIARVVVAIGQNLPKILQCGIQLLGKLLAGIIQAIPQIPGYILRVTNSIKQQFTSIDWKSLGINIIKGIANGITSSASTIANAAKQAAKNALASAKSLLGIHSPSSVFRDQVGKMVALGWAEGISDNTSAVTSAMDDLSDASVGTVTMDSVLGSASVSSKNGTAIGEVLNLLNQYLPGLADQQIVLDTGVVAGAVNKSMQSTYVRQARGMA